MVGVEGVEQPRLGVQVTDINVTQQLLLLDVRRVLDVPAGQGAAFYDALNGTKVNLASIQAVTLSNLDPGT